MDHFKNDEEFEEDMKDELDSVMGLLDRMKEDRQEELISSQSERFTRLERLKRSRVRDGDGEEQNETKYTTQVESRSRVRVGGEPVEVKVDLGGDQNGENIHDGHREGQQKRKQESVVAELREKAEIISKSARKGPEDIASTLSRTQNIEDDPEAADYLKKIRDASTTEELQEKKEQPVERSTVTVDFPSSPKKTSVTVKLNLDMQKSKIAVARGSGLQGRRKPTSEHIRRSLKLSDDEDPADILAKFDASLEEEMDADDEDDPFTPLTLTAVEASVSEAEPIVPTEGVEAKVMPQSPVEYGHKITLERRGSFEGLIPRSTPKPRKPAWKSKTYGGVALPAFAEAMKAGSKSLKKTDTAEKLLTADIVKQAAIDKLNRAAKEEIPEREPEKPAWLVEAEARRKLHDRRRQSGENVKIKPTEQERSAVPIRLKRTGSKLLDDDVIKVETPEVEDDESKTNKIVFKLKSTGRPEGKSEFEPQPAKISFKLKPTGIQLVKPEEPKDNMDNNEPPVTSFKPKPTAIQLDKPEEPKDNMDNNEPPVTSFKLKPTGIQLVKPEEPKDNMDNNEPPVTATLVKDFETEPRADIQEKRRTPVIRLRHISPSKPASVTKELKSNEESELAIKLKLRGKALPIHPDEDDREKDQIFRGYRLVTNPPSEPRKALSKPVVEEPKIKVAQSPTSYDTPRPMKVVTTSDYRAVTLDKKPLETAKLVNQQPMRTKAESTPALSQTRSAAKSFYKVTPIYSEPSPRATRGYPASTSSSASRVYEQPLSPSSSRTFSPPMSPSSSRSFTPPMSPTSKVTIVSHHVEPTPSSRSVLPAKSTRDRRVSRERGKTAVLKASEVPRIIPGRSSSSSDEPQRNIVRRTSSLEYPKSHVEKAADGHLKHAVTVVKASNIPQKATTMMATDVFYKSHSPGDVLPAWKQELLESRRKSSTSRSEQDVSARSWSSSFLSNKENEPRIVTQLEPMWMRELSQKKRNVYNLSSTNGDIQNESMAVFERLEKPVKVVDSDDEVREMPNFMKEFESKRRMKSRGFQLFQQSHPSDESYV